jgi:hypothetical protein
MIEKKVMVEFTLRYNGLFCEGMKQRWTCDFLEVQESLDSGYYCAKYKKEIRNSVETRGMILRCEKCIEENK